MLADAANGANSHKATGPDFSPPPHKTYKTSEKKRRDARERMRMKRALAKSPHERNKPPRHQETLENPVKLRIIELFAMFYTAASIKAQIELEHGISLDIKQIASYDPTKKSSAIGKKLRAVFEEVRADYVSKASEMAMAHQAHRLRLIGEVVEKATNSADFSAALKGLELAAKEMGGVLEGRTVVRHEGAVAHVHGTIEDARQEVAMRLQSLVDGGLLLPQPDDERSSGVSPKRAPRPDEDDA